MYCGGDLSSLLLGPLHFGHIKAFSLLTIGEVKKGLFLGNGILIQEKIKQCKGFSVVLTGLLLTGNFCSSYLKSRFEEALSKLVWYFWESGVTSISYL